MISTFLKPRSAATLPAASWKASFWYEVPNQYGLQRAPAYWLGPGLFDRYGTLAANSAGPTASAPFEPIGPVKKSNLSDRKRVVWGKSVSGRVEHGGRRIITKKNHRVRARQASGI